MNKFKQTLLAVVLLILVFACSRGQAPDKSAPFTAVKWENELPVVRIDNDWFSLEKLDKTDIKSIIEYCKKEYDDNYQKRFSEDLVEVLKKMGMTPGLHVEMELKKDGKTIVKQIEMTKENRRLAWQYNNDPTDPVSGGKIETGEQPVDKNYLVKAGDKTVIQPKAGHFEIKSCKITYEYTGMMQGTDILYFDDYGETVVLVQNRPSEMLGGNKTIIYKDKKTTIINHNRKNAAKSAFRVKDTEPPTIATSSNREAEGFEKLPNETIAGKECEVYKHKTMNVTYWLWNNIDLRLENYALGKNGYIKNATAVEVLTSIPNELFMVPEGYDQTYNK